MTNANDVRRAHRLVIALKGGTILSSHDADFLRSFLPELPAQKTLEEITEHVCDAWTVASGIDWGGNSYAAVSIDDWLWELYEQLKGLMDTPVAEPAKPAHPEFLETEADYENAPNGTIVACEDSPPWHKFESVWLSTAAYEGNSAEAMAGVIRCALRWGWGE